MLAGGAHPLEGGFQSGALGQIRALNAHVDDLGINASCLRSACGDISPNRSVWRSLAIFSPMEMSVIGSELWPRAAVVPATVGATDKKSAFLPESLKGRRTC